MLSLESSRQGLMAQTPQARAVPKLREDRSDHNYQIKWEEAFCVCSNSHDFLVSQGTNVTLAEECGC